MTNEVSTSAESLDSLLKEAEMLKAKLEDERQKLDDVSCKYFSSLHFVNILFNALLFNAF